MIVIGLLSINMEEKELYKLLYDICKLSYNEGRQHQFDDDWPDVGMHFKEDFEDTKIFKIIQKKSMNGKN